MGDRKGMEEEEEERDGKKRAGWGERMKSKTQTESTFTFVSCITCGVTTCHVSMYIFPHMHRGRMGVHLSLHVQNEKKVSLIKG